MFNGQWSMFNVQWSIVNSQCSIVKLQITSSKSTPSLRKGWGGTNRNSLNSNAYDTNIVHPVSLRITRIAMSKRSCSSVKYGLQSRRHRQLVLIYLSNYQNAFLKVIFAQTLIFLGWKVGIL